MAPATSNRRTPPAGKTWVRVGAEGTRALVTWDLDLSLRGPLVLPGSYTVSLVIADSGTTPVTSKQTLTVLNDPNTPGTDADVQAQGKPARAIHAEQDSVAPMVHPPVWVRKQGHHLTAPLR